VEEQLVASFAALRDEIAEMRGDRQNEGRDRRRDLHARGHAEDQESAFSQVPIEEKGVTATSTLDSFYGAFGLLRRGAEVG